MAPNQLGTKGGGTTQRGFKLKTLNKVGQTPILRNVCQIKALLQSMTQLKLVLQINRNCQVVVIKSKIQPRIAYKLKYA